MHANIHQRQSRGLKKIVDTRQPTNIGDFMRITDRRRNPMRRHAAVKFERGDKAGFDVQMGVDKARHKDFPGQINLTQPLIAAEHPHDGISANRHIGWHQIAGDQIKHPRTFQHQNGGDNAPALVDTV